MAKFCKYCGKPIPEGGACGCPQAVMAASRQTMREQACAGSQAAGASSQAQVLAGQMQRQAAQQTLSGTQAGDAAEKLKETGGLMLSFFTRPADTMQHALRAADKVPQYLTAAVFAVVLFIMTAVIAQNDTVAFMLQMADKGVLSVALPLLVSFLAVRGIYGAAVYGLSRKISPSVRFSAVMGVFSLTFCLDSMLVVLLMAASLISLVELQLALILFWGLGSMMTAYLATWAVLDGQTGKAWQMTIVLHIVLLIVLVFAAHGIGGRLLRAGIGAMGRSFGNIW